MWPFNKEYSYYKYTKDNFYGLCGFETYYVKLEDDDYIWFLESEDMKKLGYKRISKEEYEANNER